MLCLTLYISIAMSCNLLFNNVGKLAKLNSCSYVEVQSLYTALKARLVLEHAQVYENRYFCRNAIQYYNISCVVKLLLYTTLILHS